MRERTNERSAACSTCGKTFARSDTLLRHEKSHLATEDRGPVHRVTNGTFRACAACAQARSRCSGGSPCGRCKLRNLECTYPAKRRKISSVPENVMNADEEHVELDAHSTSSTADAHDTAKQPVRFQEIVFAQASENPYTGSHQPESFPSRSSGNFSHTVVVQEADRSLDQNSDVEYTSNLQQPLMNMQHNTQPPMGPTSQGFQAEQYGNSVPLEYQSNFEMPPAQFAFDSGLDGSANLNWIPLSVYPSPFGDLEQDFSFLLPQFSDSASLGTNYDTGQFDHMSQHTMDGVHRQTPTPEMYNTATLLPFGRSPASSTSEGPGYVRSLHKDKLMNEPRKKLRKSSQVQEAFVKPRPVTKHYAFPDTSKYHPEELSRSLCDESQYWSISNAFNELCVSPSRWKPFTSNHFPRMHLISHFVDLYFEYFQPTFPLIHQPSFGPSTSWITILAAAAVGSNFSSISPCIELREALAEVLRRAIATALDDETESFSSRDLVQARILHLINTVQSDRSSVRLSAPKLHADLGRWALESGLLQLVSPDNVTANQLSPEEKFEEWQKWVQQESFRRVGYFIWFLDCAFGYLCNARPLCNMDDARAPLPCSEALWEAHSAEEWFELKQKTATAPSLCSALEQMYNKKKIPPGLSDISHILLIHALYSRTWEVGTHIKQPLSEWRSTGNARGFLNTPSKDNFWLPLYPLYANWRNSACDCLDVLHWHASGVIARASGFEHHGALQLHLARIVLLTPFQEIQDLLFFLINHNVGEESKATFYVHDGSYQTRNPAKLAQIRQITWRWLREDQHKARLAMIHAGNVFWYVKRYSSKSFFEPLAIYLATIVLWTYGSYKSAALDREAEIQQHGSLDSNVQPSRIEIAAHGRGSSRASGSRTSHQSSPARQDHNVQEASAHAHPPEGSSEDEDDDEQDQPEFIHLDRPCDDEIVQHFVRNGHNMAGYMSNVGDVCKTPRKVLLEGAKLLRSKLGCWGVSRHYYDILCKASELRKTGKGGDMKHE